MLRIQRQGVFLRSSRNGGFLRVLLLAGVLLVLFWPALSFSAPAITFRKNVTLDDMRPGDVFSSNSAAQHADEGYFEPEAGWSGDVGQDGFGVYDLSEVYLSLTFTRWVNDAESNRAWLWRYRQQKNEHPSRPSFSVSFSIEDEYGNPGRLSHQSDPFSWVGASVIDDAVADESNNRRWIFFGSARLEFNLGNATRSGLYRGVLTTTLTYL